MADRHMPDLELILTAHGPGSVNLRLRFQAPGNDIRREYESRVPLRFDVDTLSIANFDGDSYGDNLGHTLFADAGTLSLFNEARAVAFHDELPLRVRLTIGANAAHLHRLHWERLRVPGDHSFLAHDEKVLFSRNPATISSRNFSPSRREAIRALAVVADPHNLAGYGLAPIDTVVEIARATTGFGDIPVELLQSAGHATMDALADKLQDHYDILYLVCHGVEDSGELSLCLESADGSAALVDASEFISRISALWTLPRLVILASCRSGSDVMIGENGVLAALGPRLARAGVPAVIAMQADVAMETVATFMPVLFRELHRDGQIDRAVAAARQAAQRHPDWWVPALYMPSISGRLFVADGADQANEDDSSVGIESTSEETHRNERNAEKIAGYREKLKENSGYLRLRGIPIRNASNLKIPLSTIYIEVRLLDERSAEQVRRDEERTAVAGAESSDTSTQPGNLADLVMRIGEHAYRHGRSADTLELDTIDPLDAVETNDKLVILGVPGSSKSTLIDFLALHYATDGHLVPVKLRLADYAVKLRQDRTISIREYALRDAAAGDAELLLALEAKADAGEVLWLLDGLDETYEMQELVSERAGALSGKAVLTSRPIGYSSAGRESWTHVEIQPLMQQDVVRFVHNWLSAIASDRKEDAVWIHERTASLQAQWSQRPHLSPLTRNPLLLTFMVLLAGENSDFQLPADRVGLYHRYIEELYLVHEERRVSIGSGAESESIRGVPPGTARSAVLFGLYVLAYYLHLAYHESNHAFMPRRETVSSLLAGQLQRKYEIGAAVAEIAAQDVLNFWLSAGLLMETNWEGRWLLSFRHLTFQEYGAARVLGDSWTERQPASWQFVRTRLHLPAWREPLLLMAGVLEPNQAAGFVDLVAGGPSRHERVLRRDLRFAADLIAEAELTETAVAARITRRLVAQTSDRKWSRRAYYLAVVLAGVLLLAALTTGHWLLLAVLVAFWLLVWQFGIVWGRSPRLQTAVMVPLRRLGLIQVNRPLFLSSLSRMGRSALTPLVAALGDADDAVRRAAVEALGDLGDSGAVRPLIGALGAGDFGLRIAAAESLVKLGHPGAVDPLIALLQDPRPQLRWTAAEVLGKLGDQRAVEPLMAALKDSERLVRWSAAEALGNLGDGRAAEPLATALDDPMVCQKAAEALGKLGDAGLDHLISALRENDALVRRSASNALGNRTDPRTVELLVVALRDPDANIRWEAGNVLGKLGDVALEPLVTALADPRGEVRWRAAEALGDLADRRATEALIAALGDSDHTVQWKVAEALGKLNDGQAVAPLIVALEGPEAQVRWTAAAALGKLGNLRAVEPLMSSLADSAYLVRWYASEALGILGDARAVEPLIAALDDAHAGVRWTAALALSKLGDRRAVDPLVADLADDRVEVRKSAVEALGNLQDARAVAPLAALLTDGDVEMRKAAVGALHNLGDASAVKLLVESLTDPDLYVRVAAVSALGDLGDDDALVPLVSLLHDPDARLRAAAAAALGTLGAERAVDPLIELVPDPAHEVSLAATSALGQLGDVALEALVAALGHSDYRQRLAGCVALTKLAHMYHGTVQRSAVSALVRRITDLPLNTLPFTALEEIMAHHKPQHVKGDLLAEE